MAEQMEMEGLDRNEKYRLTSEGKTHDGNMVYRIQALMDFGNVSAGDLGGFVESEDNLSFDPGDDSWVYDDSVVQGEGKVEKNSVVRKDSIITNSRITNQSNVSHNSDIKNSRIDGTVAQNADTFYANIKDSSLSHEVVVKNSRVESSNIENGSKVFNSKMKDSYLVNDAKISKGTDLTNVRLDDEQLEGQAVRDYDTANAIQLSDEDLLDLETLADDLDIPF